MKKIKTLIIDDSALVRQVMTEILNTDPAIDVVGTASDPYAAREKIKKLAPDVLTLDVEMPRMDGITFLENLMRLRPMPVVMVSTLTAKGADVTFRALELGAIDFVSKPKLDVASSLKEYGKEIIDKIKIAAIAKVRPLERRQAKSTPVPEKLSADAVIAKSSRPQHFSTTEKIIAIGASTGGTEAIKEVLMALPVTSPGVVIAQHIPEAFSGPFAKRMNGISALKVVEVSNTQQILPGHAYIAPGNRHLIVVRDGARYLCRLDDGPPVNRHKPSVDVLFRSVANNVGGNAVGVILTGMGDDGAQGLKEIRDAGGSTIAQDEKSSVVWGMPGAAVKIDAANQIVPLDNVANQVMTLVNST
ncbi:MAG: chemotaxis response regulator protein-glutamate methylesterase [Gammaproteobacteria bacterium]|nr:MAG: chemotaxis response regulator protein-glutamate methylesterase [Gammaproteobacteria bacterium]RLA15356.1 MAG: chemotaxis response regulator protein-glutamate methylesterase [Gammaproteobacteria bacterium]RLA15638.1 MAG: chemotaxis response regulator protein-glutamate methylesterase [Gammaproteobacteria bacterium]